MRDLFADTSLQSTFDTFGYVQLPILDTVDIRKLLETFEQYREQYSQPFHTSHFSTDTAYKASVHQAIVDTVFPKLAKILVSVKPVFANFMIKNPDKNVFMPLHADWTYVDESRFRSLAAWIPLVDTDKTNGCLGVIEGSHKLMNPIRGPRIRQSSYENDKIWVQKHGKLIPSKAGTVVIYDHALMHFSPPNASSLPRPALNLSIIPDEAELIHYTIPEGASHIEKYIPGGSSFYIEYDNFQRPRLAKAEQLLPPDTVLWIDERMTNFSPPTAKRSGILSRLFGI